MSRLSSFPMGSNHVGGTGEHLATFVFLGSGIYELGRLATSMLKRIQVAVPTLPCATSAWCLRVKLSWVFPKWIQSPDVLTWEKILPIGCSLTDRAVIHGVLSGSWRSAFLTAMAGTTSTASAVAIRLVLTRLMIPAFCKTFSMYWQIGAVPRSMFVAKPDTTKIHVFAWSCPICKCTVMNPLTSIGLLDTDRRQFTFTVCVTNVREVKKNVFKLDLGLRPCQERQSMSSTLLLCRPQYLLQYLSCSCGLIVVGVFLTLSSLFVRQHQFSSLWGPRIGRSSNLALHNYSSPYFYHRVVVRAYPILGPQMWAQSFSHLSASKPFCHRRLRIRGCLVVSWCGPKTYLKRNLSSSV